ncbi:amino acid ABC transporter substrate-binding protein [Algoriphagus sp. CAU 1675]|uniref:amino acid ABC transporter substrate-binding protein n=1 Tax=Algoriphagus sp. CAU 1675 TaxID=3032597 RepID=UPI0023DAAB94|nr:amino acid ABC transporter substrate-binding protein [Algoriphagus sp. CAU 1675]MDF2158462.1 amino acid ABC transporter substrate-binding protein [Algoriphagus sp. CAU 1675]
MRKYLFILPLFFVLNLTFSQTVPEGFSLAKSQISTGNYVEAMNSLREYLNSEKYGNLSNYARFYFAKASLETNQTLQALEVLQPIIELDWENADEVKILVAEAMFKNSQNLDALRILAQVQSADLKENVSDLTFKYLSSSSPDFLVSNLQGFKENPGYVGALSAVLQSKTVLSSDERSLYYELRGLGEATGTGKDDVLDLVVILPFTDFNSRNDSISPNTFVYELYQGLSLGVDQLKREKRQVNLLTFDSRRDLAYLKNLLQDPSILKADAIIGPIYQDEADLVSVFAENAKIPFIHPLSNLGERFANREYSFLFRPSVNDLSEGIVRSLKRQNWGKKFAIGYSNSSRDERLAGMLQQRLLQEGFFQINMKQLTPSSTGQFLQELGITTGRDSLENLVDQIIILTDDPSIAQPTFGLIESVTSDVPVVVMDSWLAFNFANYEMLEFPNFYFISNNVPEFESEEMKKFKQRFYNRYLTYPTLNASLGYELLYWISLNLGPVSGYDFRKSLDLGAFQKGKLTWGFNFQNSNSNQYVPVFGFEAGELKPLN